MHPKSILPSLSLVLLGAAIQFLAPGAVFGQWKESFESKQSVWQIQNWDTAGLGGLRVDHGQTQQLAQNGKGSYRFRFECGVGSEILASYSIPKARLIREFDPKLWIRCQKPGVQLLARVVLPETPSPTGNGPMAFFLNGQVCQRPLRWTQLGFQTKGRNSLLEQLKNRMPVLRQKYGPAVSERGAYVDMLVLNLYTGPGKQTVWVDSVTIDGLLPFNKSALPFPGKAVAFQQRTLQKESRFSVDGTAIQQDGEPFVVQAIEYNGERLAELKKLGFNSVWLKSPPGARIRNEALNQQMWLICPPPKDIVPGLIDATYDSVMVWHVGGNPEWDKQANVKETILKLEKSDYRIGRPVLVRPKSGFAAYSRMAGILSVGKEVLGTQFPLNQYGQWIDKRIRQAGSYVPFLADVWLDYPEALEDQAEAMAGRIPPIPPSPQQVRTQAFQALSAGSRGFVYRSRRSLTAEVPGNQRRRMAAAWVNRQLLQLQPWIAGSAPLGQVPQQQPNLRVYSFQTSLSRLLLCQHVYGQESWYAGDRPDSITIVSAPGAGMSDQAYRLTPTGLVPTKQSRVGADRMVELPSPSDWEVIVLTQDSRVLEYVKTISDKVDPWDFRRLCQMMAVTSTDWASRLHGAMVRSGQDPIELRNSLTRALTYRNQIQSNGSNQDLMALWQTNESVQSQIAKIHRMISTGPQSVFSQPVASPLVLHPMLVPLHWQSVARFANLQWSANSLPAGDFEDLPQMEKSKWQHIVRKSVPATTGVQLHPAAATGGKSGLVMTSRPKGSLIPAVLEGAPLEISSPEIVVPAGHLVEIRGQVRIDNPITGSMDGFQIVDSWGKEALAHRLIKTNGWKTFVIYRASKQARKLKVSFVLNGFGTVMLDEVTIRQTPLQSPAVSSAQQVRPLQNQRSGQFQR